MVALGLLLAACGSQPATRSVPPDYASLRHAQGALDVLPLREGTAAYAALLEERHGVYRLLVLRWTGRRWAKTPATKDARRYVPAFASGPYEEVDVSLAGEGQLTGRRSADLVLSVHTAGADCGVATVYVLGLRSGHLADLAQVSDSCALSARVEDRAVVLEGPVYGPGTPLCCPERIGRAVLAYRHGQWFESPRIFSISSIGGVVR